MRGRLTVFLCVAGATMACQVGVGFAQQPQIVVPAEDMPRVRPQSLAELRVPVRELTPSGEDGAGSGCGLQPEYLCEWFPLTSRIARAEALSVARIVACRASGSIMFSAACTSGI